MCNKAEAQSANIGIHKTLHAYKIMLFFNKKENAFSRKFVKNCLSLYTEEKTTVNENLLAPYRNCLCSLGIPSFNIKLVLFSARLPYF